MLLRRAAHIPYITDLAVLLKVFILAPTFTFIPNLCLLCTPVQTAVHR